MSRKHVRQKYARLRVCASCEFIFKDHSACPMCGFAHYGARFVYGRKCYRYEKTQEPWINKKVARYVDELQEQTKEYFTHNAVEEKCNH